MKTAGILIFIIWVSLLYGKKENVYVFGKFQNRLGLKLQCFQTTTDVSGQSK